jgi:hypothetical protein
MISTALVGTRLGKSHSSMRRVVLPDRPHRRGLENVVDKAGELVWDAIMKQDFCSYVLVRGRYFRNLVRSILADRPMKRDQPAQDAGPHPVAVLSQMHEKAVRAVVVLGF